MQVATEQITPEIAEAYLALNTTNRPLSKGNVTRFASMMTRGQWHSVGDPIRFDTNGKMIDGQHRLSAVVASGVTTEFLVIRGLPPESFNVLDTGRSRTPGDALSLLGVVNANLAASIARVCYVVDAGMNPYNTSVMGLVTRDDIVTWVTEHPEVNDATARGTSMDSVVGGTGTAWGSFVYLASKRCSPLAVAQFYDGVHTGASLEPTDPRLTLRNWMLRNKHAKVKRVHPQLRLDNLGCIVRTFNHYSLGHTLTAIRVVPGDLPEITRTSRVG